VAYTSGRRDHERDAFRGNSVNQGQTIDMELFGPGVYHLLQGDEVVYVGGTRNLAQRISYWVDSKAPAVDSVQVFPLPREDVPALEKEHIEQLKPRFNTAGINTPYKSPSGIWRSATRFSTKPHNSYPDQSVRFFTRRAYVHSLTKSLGMGDVRKLKLVMNTCPPEDRLLLLESIGFPCPDYCRGSHPKWFKRPVLDWLETQSFDDELEGMT